MKSASRYFSFIPSHETPRTPQPNPQSSLTPKIQGGKTFCASLIAGSRRAFLCVDCVCLLLEFSVKCTRCERLLPVSLTNSCGSRVQRSRSRAQCRGRGSSVAVADPKSRSRVQCRGREKSFGVRGNS